MIQWLSGQRLVLEQVYQSSETDITLLKCSLLKPEKGPYITSQYNYPK